MTYNLEALTSLDFLFRNVFDVFATVAMKPVKNLTNSFKSNKNILPYLQTR